MKSKDLLYEEKGGLRLGNSYWFAMNCSWPLAKIEIFKENIVITSVFSKINFNKSELTQINRFQGFLGFLGRGVKFSHKKTDTSPFVVFWSVNIDKLISKLKKAGYKIE